MPTANQTPKLPALVTLVETTDLDRYAVTRHGYRKMRVVGDDVTDGPFEYSSGDQLDRLQHRLAGAAGDRADNHETYEVVFPDGQKLCLWFHDWQLAVGTATLPY